MVPLIIFHLKRKYLCKTEDDVKAAWYPGDLGYHTRVPNDMLITTVVLCYSVMAPLIIPFGVAYFALGWLIAKNQVSLVFHIYKDETSVGILICLVSLVTDLSYLSSNAGS